MTHSLMRFLPMLMILLYTSACLTDHVPAPTSFSQNVQTLATFNASAGEHPENVALSADGTIYVTLHESAKVWKRTPSGRTQFIMLPVNSSKASATRVNGIIIDQAQNALVLVRSDRSEFAGIWKITPAGVTTKVAAFPAKAGLNGLAADKAGNLYATDDTNGLIYRLKPGASTAEIWLDDLQLDPQGASPYGFPVYGANGIKIYQDNVYVSNPSASALYKIPIQPDGSAGVVTAAYPGKTFANVDDFAFDEQGNLYVTTVTDNTVDRISPTGDVTNLLTRANELDQPTSVAFGVTAADRANLYITNASFYSPPGTASRASLQRLSVGINGALLP